MKRFFARKKCFQDEKTVLIVCYGYSLFSISKNDKESYFAKFTVLWPENRQLKRGILSGSETLPCSKNAVEEAFNLLKCYGIIGLLEEVRQGKFYDIECYPPNPFRVQCNYADLQYLFEDPYGCCYEKSRDMKTQLSMTSLMLKFAELFCLIHQGKI